jgi:hypothetical protein
MGGTRGHAAWCWRRGLSGGRLNSSQGGAEFRPEAGNRQPDRNLPVTWACLRPCVWRGRLTGGNVGHRAKACLGLFRQASKDHRNVIASVFVAGAGNDHSRTVQPTPVGRRMQRQRHLSPLGKRRGTAKLDSIPVNDDGVGGKGQAGLPRFDRKLLQRISASDFSRAHTALLQ